MKLECYHISSDRSGHVKDWKSRRVQTGLGIISSLKLKTLQLGFKAGWEAWREMNVLRCFPNIELKKNLLILHEYTASEKTQSVCEATSQYHVPRSSTSWASSLSLSYTFNPTMVLSDRQNSMVF